MARILFLTQVLPFPMNAGPKVRQYYMLRHLAERHEVTLVSFIRPDDAAEAVGHLRGLCAAVHAVTLRRSTAQNLRAGAKGLLTGLPITIVRDENAAMAGLLRRLTDKTAYDIVHADQLSMARHGLNAARLAGQPGPRTLLDEHNAIYRLTQRMAANESQPLRRLVMAREARAFARYEAATCRAYDAVLTVTCEDKEQLLALYPLAEREPMAQKFTVVPICVDPARVPAVPRQPKADGEPPVILHLGTMFWPPNVDGVLWFAREVLPLVHRQAPDARFVIAGKSPPAEIQALAQDPHVQVTGYVADPQPYVAAADAFVVPLHAGGGMRVKILDAWQWGLPIVSTSVGAEGIACEDGANILIADRPEEFAAAVLQLITDGRLNLALRREGRAWVESHYTWQAVYSRVDEVYAGLLRGYAGRVGAYQGKP